MIIVLEGPDGGGKTTLARVIHEIVGIPIVPGEGPPKHDGEMNQRVERYLAYDHCIFDRHPCVSQPIYSNIRRGDDESITLGRMQRFYDSKPVLIYCRYNGLSAQNMTFGPHEDPTHVAAVRERYADICFAYDQWAIDHAEIIVRDYQFIRAIKFVRSLQDELVKLG